MKKELRITDNSDGKFEVKINGLSGAELIMAINELIISVKKASEECGVSKHSKILNRYIQKAVDRALNGERFTSVEDVTTELFKSAFTELINDFFTEDEEEKNKDEE